MAEMVGLDSGPLPRDGRPGKHIAYPLMFNTAGRWDDIRNMSGEVETMEWFELSINSGRIKWSKLNAITGYLHVVCHTLHANLRPHAIN